MNIRYTISTVFFAILCNFHASAQVSQATRNMQKMMWLIMQEAPGDFAKIIGNEVSKNDKGTFYTAELSRMIKTPEEMKKALVDNFFGAMLTTDDNIVKTGNSTIYLAKYANESELSVTEMVRDALLGMPEYLAMGADVAKVEEVKMGDPTVQQKWVLMIKGVNIAGYTLYPKDGKGMLIIGIKK